MVVYIAMVSVFAPPEKKSPLGGYVVRGPRITDAMGKALRRSFRQDGTLPSSLAILIAELDRLS